MDLECNKEYPYTFIGVLPTKEEILSNENVEGCYKTKGRAFFNDFDLQFVIKVIGNIPEEIKRECNTEYFTAYKSSIYEWNDNINNSNSKRIDDFIKFLDNKLIIFKLYVTSNEYHRFKVSTKNACVLMDMPKGINRNSRLMPVLKCESSYLNMEKCLLEHKAIDITGNVNEEKKYASILLNRNTLYGELQDAIKNEEGKYICKFDNPIKKIKIDLLSSNFTDFIVEYSGDMYIEEEFMYHVIDEWLANGEIVNAEVACPVEEQEDVESDELKEKEEEKRVRESEKNFIKALQNKALSEHLVYTQDDLINFHTAIKSGSLVILSGMSGIGKSKLVEIYAKTLKIYNTLQCKMISVKPNWNDDSDLIGFLDSINNIYRPASTGLVDTLIEASQDKNKDKVFLICFDEMNLSKVEYYFSEFLSVLEQDTPYRKLTLYNKNIENRVFNGNEYKSEIKIGKNVFFVGTINIDESTFHFSDKVLDRATVISSQCGDFHKWKEIMNSTESYESVETQFLQGDFIKWIINGNQVILEDRELDFLNKMNNCLKEINPTIGIGYRVLYQINKYVANVPNNMMDRKKAIDFQVVQKILTKIRGSADILENYIGENKEIISIINEFSDISDFENSKKMLFIKEKEMKEHGFIS